MTREEAIDRLKEARAGHKEFLSFEALDMAIKALEQEPCDDCISREEMWKAYHKMIDSGKTVDVYDAIKNLPSVSTQTKIGKCKDCKHFEYNSVADVRGIPLIVAHEICSRWGDGCQSKEDGYCFLFEPKTQEVKE